jgi:hypothetical protein
VEPTTDIFEFFRDLNVFKRNRKRFELKVIAVLLYAFGLSLRKTSRFFQMGALRARLEVECRGVG